MFVFKPFVRYPFCNLYRVLGVTSQATEAQIKQSYYQLAKKKHPDTGTISSQQFMKIQSAYQVLRNPQSRHQYDKEQFPEKFQEFQRSFTYYTEETKTENPSHSWVKGLELFGVLGVCAGILYLIRQYLKPMTQHEIRRQNIFLANQNIDDGPAAQEKRRKQYLLQMKQKKFTANVVQLKVSDGSQQSTKAKNIKKSSIQSIPGICKEAQYGQDNSDKERYM